MHPDEEKLERQRNNIRDCASGSHVLDGNFFPSLVEFPDYFKIKEDTKYENSNEFFKALKQIAGGLNNILVNTFGEQFSNEDARSKFPSTCQFDYFISR